MPGSRASPSMSGSSVVPGLPNMTETPSCLRIWRNACLPVMYAIRADDKPTCACKEGAYPALPRNPRRECYVTPEEGLRHDAADRVIPRLGTTRTDRRRRDGMRNRQQLPGPVRIDHHPDGGLGAPLHDRLDGRAGAR